MSSVTVKSSVSALVRRQLDLYHAAETPQLQRDHLLLLHGVTKMIALTEPVTHFGDFSDVQELAVSEKELSELLAGYRASLTTPAEKTNLARIQNCVLRGLVSSGQSGAERVLGLMNSLQQGLGHKLILI